jgi:hypothetical protein
MVPQAIDGTSRHIPRSASRRIAVEGRFRQRAAHHVQVGGARGMAEQQPREPDEQRPGRDRRVRAVHMYGEHPDQRQPPRRVDAHDPRRSPARAASEGL